MNIGRGVWYQRVCTLPVEAASGKATKLALIDKTFYQQKLSLGHF